MLAAGQPARKSVSANSFRQLTAFLKKEPMPALIPEIAVAIPAVAPMIEVAPELAPINVFAPSALPAFDPAPQPEIHFAPEPAPISVFAPSALPAFDPAPQPEIHFAPEPELAPISVFAPSSLPAFDPEPQPEIQLAPEPEPAPISVFAPSPLPAFDPEPQTEIRLAPEPEPAPINVFAPSALPAFDPAPQSEIQLAPEPEPINVFAPSSLPAFAPAPQPEIQLAPEPESAPINVFAPSALPAFDPEPQTEIRLAPEPEPAPINVFAPSPLPAFAPAPQPEIQLVPEPAPAPEVMWAPEPVLDAAPMVTVFEAAAPEPYIEPVTVSAPEALQVETAPVLVMPELVLMQEPQLEAVAPPAPIPAPVAVKPPSSILRRRAEDAFALPPSALVQSKPAAVVQIVQSPEQELESAELARSLLDMMASGASSGLPQERALAADTLLRMLPRLPMKSMIMLAERLCIMETPPHMLVAKLICDPRIEVAGPLLEECMHITDEDLSLVIAEKVSAKLRMMARRRRISRAITSQLVDTGDPSVQLTLVRNLQAEIPHESFIALTSIAAVRQELLAPLCIRPDLPVPFAFELFWSAPAQLRRYLLSRFLTDSETLTKILKIALETNGDEAASPVFPDPERIKDALQLLDDGKSEEAAALMGDCAQIDAATAARILADRQGEPLAALFKAVGVPRNTVNEILNALMTSASGILDPSRDPEELQSLFDTLSFNKARILLTYWDWATLKTGPYAPLN
jgi:uncharacterized protein (DUF2336 family)